jgi:hypothetical protein
MRPAISANVHRPGRKPNRIGTPYAARMVGTRTLWISSPELEPALHAFA